jgi:hypothetical protein
MKRFLPLIGAAIVILTMPLMAMAESATWTGGSGSGSDLLPCTGGGHWVLSDAQAVKSATLVVVGGTYDMQPDGNDGFSADSSGPIVLGDVAVVTYDGGGQPSLSLTGCDGSSPSPDPSPTPTPSPSDSPPPSGSPGPGHTGGSGGTGSSDHTPVIRGGTGGISSTSGGDGGGRRLTASQKRVRDLAAKHGPLPAAIHRALTSGASGATDPPSVAVGAADGAVQQAWNDGGSDPFQDVRHPPRALVIAVLIVVAAGVGGAFLARHRLIHTAS